MFIELKTDTGSRRENQDSYLEQCRVAKMESILKGIIKISSVTSYKKKYSHLLAKLQLAGLLSETPAGHSVKIGAEKIKILYVQPRVLETDSNKDILDFNRLADTIEKCYPESELMKRLSLSLKTWCTD